MAEQEIRVGVIGCGGFGLFALQHFAQLPGVRLTGMSGTHRDAARAAAERYGLPDIMDVEKMVRREDVDLVYISTPPFLHHPQAMLALEAGKHVICEKPVALTREQAEEMVAAARKRDLLLVTNLMQRYNPIYEAVKRIIDSRALGEVLHGSFENYASDEGLPPEHWFWDRRKSGGIFIEHSVHFFDLFEGWFGPGNVVAAQRTLRPGTPFEEQVHCTTQYGETILVDQYHGFHQPSRMDRQELRLVFERGDLSLYEWIPVTGRLHAIASEADTRKLSEILPEARIDVIEPYASRYRTCLARNKSIDVYHLFEMTFGRGEHKWVRYGELLRGMIHDQVSWIRDRNHKRKINEQNGVRSLLMALEADRLAHL